MSQDYAPKLGAGLALLNLFGLTSTTAKILAAFILTSIITYTLLRYRYPCCSPPSLMKIVVQATAAFDKCKNTDAFQEGEYDKFATKLRRTTFHASEIAYRTCSNGYIKKPMFLWKRLKDTVECHREARKLVFDLEMCLKRDSRVRAEFQLQVRRVRSGENLCRRREVLGVDELWPINREIFDPLATAPMMLTAHGYGILLTSIEKGWLASVSGVQSRRRIEINLIVKPSGRAEWNGVQDEITEANTARPRTSVASNYQRHTIYTRGRH
ncbi:hypothetical protein L218DRAFT_949979 [Marasmius fiardii PR-910]|nr:hypothetical protein L218DRAFT_949979 [Marasmius fiardii PR-910]